MNASQIGFERNHIPRDEADSSCLVPEMMAKLMAGESIPLLYSRTDCRSMSMTAYVESVATDDSVSAALADIARGIDRPDFRDVLTAAVRAECERDADLYAGALMAGYCAWKTKSTITTKEKPA